jgi:anaerobic ribonucleoside-triphosphate reductase activating protein
MIPVNLFPDVFPSLNVAEIDIVEGAAGPGRRLVVWLQGCFKRCPECANGSFLSARRARVMTVADVIEIVKRHREISEIGEIGKISGITGITLSGGEPMLQAAALIPLLRAVRAHGLNTVSYTGYTIEELRAEGGVLVQLLDELDLLIDGEYRRESPRGGIYRPSANQRLHFLAGRIAPADCAAAAETVVRIAGGRAFTTGTLPSNAARLLTRKLGAAGIVLRATTRPE